MARTEVVTRTRKAPEQKPRFNVFHQRLGSLTYYQACRLLGSDGEARMRRARPPQGLVLERDVFLGGDLLRVRVPAEGQGDGPAVVTFTLQSARAKQIQVNCDCATAFCAHIVAALQWVLEAKIELGLAAPPDESIAMELLTPTELIARAIADRERRAEKESMTVRATDPDRCWTDYVVLSHGSGKSYRVALRGLERGQSYCSCPDFRTNGLGICKHILHVSSKVRKRFSPSKLRAPYRRKNLSLRVHYGDPNGLRFNLPTRCDDRLRAIVDGADQRSITDVADLMHRITALEQHGYPVHVYPDAEDLIQRGLVQQRLQQACADIRRNPAAHPLRKELLAVELLPYQIDGIAFAVGAGRAILADDMGLGKTIQGIGVAELLARLAEIRRVLVICPASLKSQWQSEIQRFSCRSSQLVMGNGQERVAQYQSDTFFTICNYEQVMRDLLAVEAVPWDLIILDEGQRIKNWESQTSNAVRALRSPFRLVLSGTPLENNLGELFTVIRFVDEQRLGPAHAFFHRHRVVNENGRVVGYRKLDELRKQLEPVLLRRTRAGVMSQLPERTDEIVRITPTAEQADLSEGQVRIASQIAAKRYLTEMDLLRIQKALLAARMAADSTFLVTKEEPEYSSKLERLEELFEGLLPDPSRKIVLFSEWKVMLDRIERRLARFACDYVRLDGSVPQVKRPGIVAKFQSDPACRLILMTNAGSTGLNLQSANTVINVDLPWNPAVLEQRIARAHRMGQRNPVHVYKLVTVDTIEERLLSTLADKQDLANAALDMQSDVESMELSSGSANLRERLERILTPPLTKPVDVSEQQRVSGQTQAIAAQRQQIGLATGQLVSAALNLAGQVLGQAKPSQDPNPATVARMTEQLQQLVGHDADGRPQLTIPLAGQETLRGLAETLARLLGT